MIYSCIHLAAGQLDLTAVSFSPCLPGLPLPPRPPLLIGLLTKLQRRQTEDDGAINGWWLKQFR